MILTWFCWHKRYPGTGEYDKFFGEGVYTCAGCGTPLYKSTTKFNSGCGWPAFFEGLPGAINRNVSFLLFPLFHLLYFLPFSFIFLSFYVACGWVILKFRKYLVVLENLNVTLLVFITKKILSSEYIS